MWRQRQDEKRDRENKACRIRSKSPHFPIYSYADNGRGETVYLGIHQIVILYCTIRFTLFCSFSLDSPLSSSFHPAGTPTLLSPIHLSRYLYLFIQLLPLLLQLLLQINRIIAFSGVTCAISCIQTTVDVVMVEDRVQY